MNTQELHFSRTHSQTDKTMLMLHTHHTRTHYYKNVLFLLMFFFYIILVPYKMTIHNLFFNELPFWGIWLNSVVFFFCHHFGFSSLFMSICCLHYVHIVLLTIFFAVASCAFNSRVFVCILNFVCVCVFLLLIAQCSMN